MARDEFYSIEWASVNELPVMSSIDEACVLEYSRVKNGKRQFPFIKIYDNKTGEYKRIFLGA
jgi:hypothetical protein